MDLTTHGQYQEEGAVVRSRRFTTMTTANKRRVPCDASFPRLVTSLQVSSTYL